MGSVFGEAEISAYVVDNDHRIIYFNKTLEQRFSNLRTGQLCYRALRGTDAPCPECPLRVAHDGKALVYNRILKKWINVEIGDIEWPGAGPCHILLCRQASGDEVDANQPPTPSPEPYYDLLTGLRERGAFLSCVAELLAQYPDADRCLMAIDIEHFKLFNEWYGEDVGDRFLQKLAELLRQAEKDYDAVAGYMRDDDFCIVMPSRSDFIAELQDSIEEEIHRFSKEMAFLPAFGLYAIDDVSVPVGTMYDRALLAAASVKGNYAQRSCWYEAGMTQEMEEDHTLLQEVQRALVNGEFCFYLQPKCTMATGKIVGAEALVRWVHPERGLIPPGRFVPLLERNGLITALDLHLWEQVCLMQRTWIDRGYNPVPISVNVSRRDVYAIDVVEAFSNLTKQHGIDPRLIAVEITESAYVEDAQKVSSLADRLRTLGFAVFMDDFGSGYSSLNMLKDLNVDVLKLDMKLLDVGTERARKGKSILESIINMARLVDLRIIAEGVETEEQRDFLMKAGCLYAQGYYFYRPLPPERFEQLFDDRQNFDFRGLQADPIEQLQVRQLLNDSVLSDTMMDDILGAIAFYDVCGDKIEVVSVNEQYCRLTGIDPIDLEERRTSITRLVYQADWPAFSGAFDRALRNAPAGAEVDVRRMRSDGTTVYIHFRVFFLRERDGHRFFYGSLSDVTEQVKKAQMLESSQRALSAVVGVSSSDSAFMNLAEENRRTAATIFAQMSPGGMIGGYCEEGFPLYFANAAMVELLGYDTYDELSEAIGGLVENTIHPDDRAAVTEDIGPAYYAGLEYTTTYRMPKKDGTWFWTLDKGKVVEAEDGRLAIVSACTDISEVMAVQQQLAERNELLLSQNRELMFLNKDMPDGYHRCADTPGFDFLFVSDRFTDTLGYTRKEIKDLFDNKFANMVHPDDRERVAEGVAALREGRLGDAMTLEYRVKTKDGYVTVVDQSRYLEYDGVPFLQGVIVDVTETVELRDTMRMLMEYTCNDIVTLTWSDRSKVDVRTIARGVTRRFGLSEEEFAAFFKGYLNRVRPDTGRTMFDDVADAAERRRTAAFTGKVEYPSGESVWMRVEVQPIDAAPGLFGALCLGVDVTELKQREQELRATQRKLESVLRLAGIDGWKDDADEGGLAG